MFCTFVYNEVVIMKRFVSKVLLLSFLGVSLAQGVIAHTDDSGDVYKRQSVCLFTRYSS